MARNQQHKHSRFIWIAVILVVIAGVAFGALHRTIVSSENDPSGMYTAEVSYRTFYSFIPMAPGSSSDKPGFVEIFKKGAGSLGRIPVPMLQMSGVKWESPGASVAMVGEWDFVQGTCYYWGDGGNRKIYVTGKPTS